MMGNTALQSDSALHFTRLFEHFPDAYLFLDIDSGLVFDCNAAAEKMLRSSKSGIIGLSPEHLSPETQPNGANSSILARERIQEAIEQGHHRFEWMHRRLDGEMFLCDVNISFFELEGKRVLLGCWRDISEIKNVEKALEEERIKFKTLYDNSPDAYLTMELNGGIVSDCNESAVKMLRAKKEQILGLTPDRISPEYQECGGKSSELVKERIKKILEKGHHRFNWIHKRLDGEEFPCDVNISLVELEGRKVMLVGWRDISNFREKEEKLKQINDELEQFSYRCSHDLKAPLSTIKNLSKFVTKDINSGRLHEALINTKRIYEQSTRLERLVIDILELAKSDLRKVNAEALIVRELVEEIKNSLISELEVKQVAFKNELGQDTTIWMQRPRLEQVLYNLIANSIKYSDPNKDARYVTVTCNLNDSIVITVSDNGVGIKPENQNKIFDMFTRFDPHLAEGSGLGMAIVKRHVDALDGKMQYSSSESGTTFTLTFPNIKAGTS